MKLPASYSIGREALITHPATALAAGWSEEVILDVTVPEQRQTEWCWAAVSFGIADAYGDNPPSQCDLVINTLGGVLQCCSAGKEPKCHCSHTLDEPLENNVECKQSNQH